MLLFLVTLSLGKFLEFSVYFSSTPSKLKVQVFVTIFSNTFYFAVYTSTMGVACPLSLYALVDIDTVEDLNYAIRACVF